MGADSKIEWTHHTFNPWWGCQRVSPGCEHCYAETFSKRVGLSVWGPSTQRRTFGDKHWDEPLKWNRDAEKAGERRRVFCASMADVFENRPELALLRCRLRHLVDACPWLDFLLLTKRPENAAVMMAVASSMPWAGKLLTTAKTWPSNVWLGTTVEDQRRADERIPHLLRCNAAVSFLSCEPLLEHVNVSFWLRKLAGTRWAGVDWVIIGGESGGGARPFELSWARSIVLQCRDAGVPVLVKQLGAAASDPENGIAGASLKVHPDAAGLISIRLKDRKGGDWSEWPEDLRIREYPVVAQGGVLAHAPDCRSRR